MAKRVDVEGRFCPYLPGGRNRTERENIMSPGGGDFDGAFDMLLTFDFAEIKVLFS